MYLTSKNLFIVVYCCIFAPLKRILLRGGSPLTIISSLLKRGESPQTTISSKKNRPYGFVPSDNFFTSKRKRGESPQTIYY